MNEEEELKHIINSKLSGEEVPFDEENWEEAEKFIDASRRKEKRRRWALIFFIGFGAGIAIMLPFLLNKTNQKNIKTHDSLNTKIGIENRNAEGAGNNVPQPEQKTVTTDSFANNTSAPTVVTDKTVNTQNQPAVMNANKTDNTVNQPTASTTSKANAHLANDNYKPSVSFNKETNTKGEKATSVTHEKHKGCYCCKEHKHRSCKW